MDEEMKIRQSTLPRREDSQEALRQAIIYEREQLRMSQTKRELVKMVKGINKQQIEQSRKHQIDQIGYDNE